MTLKKIPAIILIATFICGRNPEATDKKMFKGGLRKTRRKPRKNYI